MTISVFQYDFPLKFNDGYKSTHEVALKSVHKGIEKCNLHFMDVNVSVEVYFSLMEVLQQ